MHLLRHTYYISHSSLFRLKVVIPAKAGIQAVPSPRHTCVGRDPGLCFVFCVSYYKRGTDLDSSFRWNDKRSFHPPHQQDKVIHTSYSLHSPYAIITTCHTCESSIYMRKIIPPPQSFKLSS